MNSDSDLVNYCAADDAILLVHDDVMAYALAVNDSLLESRTPEDFKDLSFIALDAMFTDIVTLHLAIRSLCESGWAFAAPILLRTSFDLLLGAGAVHNSGTNARFLGFKYLFSATRASLHDAETPDDTKVKLRQQAEDYASTLSASEKERALGFLGESRTRPYWYSPEFARPSEIISAIAATEVRETYHWLSGAAHAGFSSLRSWRDSPDDASTGPRRDPASQNRALAFSSVTLLNFTMLRAAHEGVGPDEIANDLRSRISNLKPIVEASHEKAMAAAEDFATDLAKKKAGGANTYDSNPPLMAGPESTGSTNLSLRSTSKDDSARRWKLNIDAIITGVASALIASLVFEFGDDVKRWFERREQEELRVQQVSRIDGELSIRFGELTDSLEVLGILQNPLMKLGDGPPGAERRFVLTLRRFLRPRNDLSQTLEASTTWKLYERVAALESSDELRAGLSRFDRILSPGSRSELVGTAGYLEWAERPYWFVSEMRPYEREIVHTRVDEVLGVIMLERWSRE